MRWACLQTLLYREVIFKNYATLIVGGCHPKSTASTWRMMGNASAEGYTLEDGTALNLSDKDQKWLGLKDTFKF